jgi:ATP-dependent helicase Lhr and Lhr-like helicase
MILAIIASIFMMLFMKQCIIYYVMKISEYWLPIKKQTLLIITLKSCLKESCYVFKAFKLATERLIQFGDTVYLLPWKSDKIVNTLFTLLLREKLSVDINAGIITIADTSIEQVKAVL